MVKKSRKCGFLCKTMLFALLFCTASCTHNGEYSNSSEVSQKEKEGVIAVFYAPGSRGDMSYTDTLSLGVNRAAIKHNLLLAQYEPESLEKVSASFNEAITLCDKMLEKKNKCLILFTSPLYESFISANSEKISVSASRGIVFLMGEAKESSCKNVNTYCMNVYGVNYQAGLAADLLLGENEKVLILLLDKENAFRKKSAEAFISGFCARQKRGSESDAVWTGLLKEVLDNWNEESKINNVLVTPVYEKAEDTSLLSESLYTFAKVGEDKTLGVNLILPYCGGGTHGLLLYNRENPFSFYTVGTDTDLQCYSGRVPFSIVKHIDTVIEKCVEDFLAGKLPEHQNFGLEGDYTELVISVKYIDRLETGMESSYSAALEKEKAYEK